MLCVRITLIILIYTDFILKFVGTLRNFSHNACCIFDHLARGAALLSIHARWMSAILHHSHQSKLTEMILDLRTHLSPYLEGFKINLHFEQDWPWLMIWLNANMRSSPLNLQVNIYWKSLLREAATESLQMNIYLSLWGGEEIKLGKVASSFQREEPRSKRDDRSLKKGEVLIVWWWKFERR